MEKIMQRNAEEERPDVQREKIIIIIIILIL